MELRRRYSEAQALFQQGRLDEALQTLEALLQEHPRHADLLLSRALCLEALGRPREALAAAQQGQVIEPDPRLAALVARLEQQQPAAAPPIDTDALLKRLEALDERTSPLAFLTTRRAYVIVFLLMFLLLAGVGPMLWWGLIARPGQ